MLHIPYATARDFMQKDMVLLQADAPIQEAIDLFEDYHISGAAVVDGAGEPVGVISETDILRRDSVRGRGPSAPPKSRISVDLDQEDEEIDESIYENLNSDTVGDYMTTRLVAVEPDAAFQDICALLSDESIHRVFVVENKKIVGIITTTDIVKRIAQVTRI